MEEIQAYIYVGAYITVGNKGNKQVNIYTDVNSISIYLKRGNFKICSWLIYLKKIIEFYNTDQNLDLSILLTNSFQCD